MKAEIELTKHGECVELTFDYTYYPPEPAVNACEEWEFTPETMIRIDEDTGEKLPVESAEDLVITPYIAGQLIDLVVSVSPL